MCLSKAEDAEAMVEEPGARTVAGHAGMSRRGVSSTNGENG